LTLQIEKESAVRIGMLRQIALGEKTDKDVQVQSAKILNLKAALVDVTDLYDSVQKAIPDQSRKVQKMAEKVQGKKHEFWFLISTREAVKITEIEAGPLLRCWGAYLLSGGPPNIGPWLLERFKGFTFQSEQICRSLEKEYLESSGEGVVK
jgi:hypothetical protein